jgi:hypothetical protein
MDDKSITRTIADSHQAGVDLLITDCRMALTLLDMAETTTLPESRSRQIGEAHHAYDTILHFLHRLSPTAEQAQQLNTQLEKLRTRLRAAGVSI